MLLEDSSLWHLKVKFMPTRPLQKHCNSMAQPSPLQTHRARMRHVCKIPFIVQKRPKLPKGWMHSRRQTTAGDSSCFSLQPCIQLFVLPQKLSAFLHLGLKAWKPWLLIANQQSLLSCFHAFNPLHSWQFRAQNEMLFPCLENSGRCCESIPKLFQLLIPDDSSAAARLTGLHPWCRIVHTINLIKLFRRRAPSACDLQILERCLARFFPAPCFLPSDTQDATSSQAL